MYVNKDMQTKTSLYGVATGILWLENNLCVEK